MDTLLDLCSAVMILTGGFVILTLWLVVVIAFVIEIHDRRKERSSKEE